MAMGGNALGIAIKDALDGLSEADQQDTIKCWQALASAIVSHIQNNATVTIKTSDAGLQRDNTGGNPSTLAPGSNKTLPAGTIQ